MAVLESIDSQSPATAKEAVTAAATKAAAKAKSQGGANPSEMFGIIFYLLVDAMQVRQDTVLTQSKELQSNASIQNRLNALDGAVKFSVLPYGAGTVTINAVQDDNQMHASVRENIQNNLITARQTGQVLMTQTDTNVNLLQQDASEDSGWLQTLNTIFQVIDEMSPGH